MNILMKTIPVYDAHLHWTLSKAKRQLSQVVAYVQSSIAQNMPTIQKQCCLRGVKHRSQSLRLFASCR